MPQAVERIYLERQSELLRKAQQFDALLAAAKALLPVIEDRETYKAWKREFDALRNAIKAAEREKP